MPVCATATNRNPLNAITVPRTTRTQDVTVVYGAGVGEVNGLYGAEVGLLVGVGVGVGVDVGVGIGDAFRFGVGVGEVEVDGTKFAVIVKAFNTFIEYGLVVEEAPVEEM